MGALWSKLKRPSPEPDSKTDEKQGEESQAREARLAVDQARHERTVSRQDEEREKEERLRRHDDEIRERKLAKELRDYELKEKERAKREQAEREQVEREQRENEKRQPRMEEIETVEESFDESAIYAKGTKRFQPVADGLVDFVSAGGDLSVLLNSYKVPRDWDQNRAQEFPLGLFEVDREGQTIVTSTIYLPDDNPGTKRHFLAFYGLQVHYITPPDFLEWCAQMEMHNTVNDYLSFYHLSKFCSSGSTILRGLFNAPGSLGIEMSDRFVVARGSVRAVRFLAIDKRHASMLTNQYLNSMKRDMEIGTIRSHEYRFDD
ncbi:unnamed protein product [Protopolystoma xenopodis]|uniref:Uncharacterized protein n=1 Tax=Protopolystoma xenopodis TaxID=117903 RepID=A0A3S4ZYW3_9PLAT|nr:unnamed protein product [Protopolystoma xenopodis]